MKIGKQSWSFLVGLFHLALIQFTAGEDDLKQSLQPEITADETDVTFNKGKTAKLHCIVKNQGTKTGNLSIERDIKSDQIKRIVLIVGTNKSYKVIWRRLDETNPLTIGTFPYVSDKRISTIHHKYSNTWMLQIRKVELSDAGMYECQVSSKEHIVKHFKLTVSDEDIEEEKIPPVVLTGRKYVEIGQPILLVCNATGEEEPPMDLDWFKDGDKINSVASSKVEITKYKTERSIISELIVQRARMKDKGDYVCRAGIKDDDAASFGLFVLNAATNNVKRGTEKEEKANAEKNAAAKAKEVSYDIKNGSGKSMTTGLHPIYLITWVCVLLHFFQYTLQTVAHPLRDSS